MYGKLVKPANPILNRAHMLSRGLLAAWVMAEGGGTTLRDLSGRNNGATIVGSIAWGFHAPGRVLDSPGGAGDRISINTPAALSTGSGTAERTAFIVYKTTATNASLFGFRAADPNPIFDFQLGADGVDNANTGKLSFIVRATGGSGLAHIHDAVATNDGLWHSAAAWMNSAKAMRIYRDGIIAASGTHSMTAGSTFIDMRIGDESLNAAIANIVGSIAIALIYDRALTDYEILQLHRDPYVAFRPAITRIGLSIAAPTTTTVALSWTDNSVGETGYSIERSTDGINYSEIGTAAADATSYNDDTAALATTYYYRVKATGSPADSDYSNVATITTA